MSSTMIVTLIYHRHKPTDAINLLGSQWRRNVFPVRYECYPPCVLNKDRTMDNVQYYDSYINIPSSQTYRCH
jgi:hypothetical protein